MRIPSVNIATPMVYEAPIRSFAGNGESADSSWDSVRNAVGTVGLGLGAYHGYKRNDSIGWAIVWALCGSAVPIIPIAFAQGFAEPAGKYKSNKRRRRSRL